MKKLEPAEVMRKLITPQELKKYQADRLPLHSIIVQEKHMYRTDGRRMVICDCKKEDYAVSDNGSMLERSSVPTCKNVIPNTDSMSCAIFNVTMENDKIISFCEFLQDVRNDNFTDSVDMEIDKDGMLRLTETQKGGYDFSMLLGSKVSDKETAPVSIRFNAHYLAAVFQMRTIIANTGALSIWYDDVIGNPVLFKWSKSEYNMQYLLMPCYDKQKS